MPNDDFLIFGNLDGLTETEFFDGTSHGVHRLIGLPVVAFVGAGQDDDRDLAVLPMGGCGSSAVFRLGVDCDHSSMEHDMEELGSMNNDSSIRLGLCCIFHDQPIKFRNTTVKAIGNMERDAALAKLAGLCMANAEALQASLQFCADNGIGCFRINSQILAMSTNTTLPR